MGMKIIMTQFFPSNHHHLPKPCKKKIKLFQEVNFSSFLQLKSHYNPLKFYRIGVAAANEKVDSQFPLEFIPKTLPKLLKAFTRKFNFATRKNATREREKNKKQSTKPPFVAVSLTDEFY